jgi:Tfp pilus assembly protein PilO
VINFKNRDDIVPSAVIVCAILILAATIGYVLLVPAPSAAGAASARTRTRRQLLAETTTARAATAQARASANARLWKGNADTVMALVLAQMTRRAAGHNLQIAAFRPQKPQIIGGATELPLNMQVSGPYLTVLAFVNSFDTADARLVLRSIQFGSTDGASNVVTATVGLSAYYLDDTPAAPAVGMTQSSAATVQAAGAPPVSMRTNAAAAGTGGSLG